MLSKTQMVKAREAVESLYDGKCTIIEYKKVKKKDMSTDFQEVVILENEPCRLSSNSISTTGQTDTLASSIVQIVKVFLAPEIQVKPGSKFIITQNGVTTEYKSSGVPAYYSTHQEVILELLKGWS